MPFPELVQLDPCRGLNLRALTNWQDGSLGPVDGEPRPGVVRVKMAPTDVWDLTGDAAARFRAAIREAAWCPEIPGDAGEDRSPGPAPADVEVHDSSVPVQARSYDPRTGEPLGPGAVAAGS